MRLSLVAAFVIGAAISPAGVLAQSQKDHNHLRAYMSRIAPQIKTYKSIAKQADDVLSAEPSDDVQPFVDGLSEVSDRFDRLASRWNAIKAPPGLVVKHRGMGGAFRLQAQSFGVWAEAWEQYGQTHDLTILSDANEHVAGFLHSAAYLQKRWAAALRGALTRASIPVPTWLEHMATTKP